MLSDGIGQDAKHLKMIGEVTGNKDLQKMAKGVEKASKVLGAASKVFGGLEKVTKGIEDLAKKAQTRKVRYVLTVDGVEARWKVTAFEMTEGLSELYDAELSIKCEDRDADVTDLLGKDAEVLLRRDDHSRKVCGIVRRVEEGSAEREHITAKIWVAPALFALGLGSDTRFFHPDKSAPQIVEAVLTEALRPYGRELDMSHIDVAAYTKREYCVQYRESHLDFVRRLLVEEGIGFYFEHGDTEDASSSDRSASSASSSSSRGSVARDKIVLFDATNHYVPVPRADDNPIPFAAESAAIERGEIVLRLAPRRQLTVTGATVRDYDWLGGTDVNRTPGIREVDDLPDGLDGRVRAAYDHQPALPMDDGEAITDAQVATRAEIRREALRRDESIKVGVGLVIGFAPGRWFELTGHSRPGGDGEYVLTKVVHRSGDPEGHPRAGGQSYYNTFECIPKDARWRPLHLPDKPRVRGIHTATVVGEGDEEIFTDPHGRIKVQFHWDRHRNHDEHSSCWIRVSQIWAGVGYPGFVFIPRVGMEVIVTFVDGDPDRPVVTGCVYNGNHPVPEELPSTRTRSILRTRSTPNGSGHNELSFEDQLGQEEVYLRAERNLKELVQNNHDTHVMNCQTNTVDVDQTQTIGRDQTERVKRDQSMTVDRDRTKQVRGDETNTIGPDTGNRATTVHGNDDLKILKTHRVEVLEGEHYQITQGQRLTVVSQDRHTRITDHDNLTVTQQYNIDVGEHYKCWKGDTYLFIKDVIYGTAVERVHFTAPRVELYGTNRIRLWVGSSQISITDEGISISAPKVEINGQTLVDIDSGGLVKVKC